MCNKELSARHDFIYVSLHDVHYTTFVFRKMISNLYSCINVSTSIVILMLSWTVGRGKESTPNITKQHSITICELGININGTVSAWSYPRLFSLIPLLVRTLQNFIGHFNLN